MELFCQITAIMGLIRFSQILNILSLMNYILTAERLERICRIFSGDFTGSAHITAQNRSFSVALRRLPIR